MINVETLDDWKNVLKQSEDRTVILLKHSTTCPISAEAFNEFKAFQEDASECIYALVKVIEHRPVSNAIAEETEIKHESPQCFILKNQQVQWVDSHWKITQKSLKQALLN